MADATDLNHLPPAEGRLGALFARPKAVAAACVVVLATLGWAYLAWLTAANSVGALDAICRALATEIDAASLAFTGLMWAAMTLAMMLPSAAPMIYTYAEIADTAAKKGERIVSPFVLAGGYTAVWLSFAVLATAVQFALTRLALLNDSMTSTSGLFSGAIFIAAGVYQFTDLKHACLTQCRNPFPFFFTNWQTTARGVFRLGVKQGLFCLGCCWAMMTLMLAVGIMNVIWMAVLGVVVTIEKMVTGHRYTQILGAVLIGAGLAIAGTAIAAHWPGRAI